MDDILVWKVTLSVSLNKIKFPKISEQAPLMEKLIRFWKTFLGITGTRNY